MGLKILLINTQMEFGGAQKAMLQLANGLILRGHKVTVATMYDKGNFIPLFEEKYGVNIINLQMKKVGGRNPFVQIHRSFNGLINLYLLMRREGFDVVQTFTHYSNILVPPLGALAHCKAVITSERSSLIGDHGWVRLLDKIVTNSGMVKKMVAVSEATRQYCNEQMGIKMEKSTAILNGIDIDSLATGGRNSNGWSNDLRKELGIHENSLITSVVGRLHRQKGHEVLIKAVSRIVNKTSKIQVLFVGDGPLKEELQNMIAEYRLQKTILLLGNRIDINDILGISDVFVLPSLWEGLPNAILEAMAAKLPVIATDVGGTKEVVVDGKTGLLVPPGDVDSLEKCLYWMIQDAEKREEMGKVGYQRILDNFTLKINIDKFESLYLDTLHRKIYTR